MKERILSPKLDAVGIRLQINLVHGGYLRHRYFNKHFFVEFAIFWSREANLSAQEEEIHHPARGA